MRAAVRASQPAGCGGAVSKICPRCRAVRVQFWLWLRSTGRFFWTVQGSSAYGKNGGRLFLVEGNWTSSAVNHSIVFVRMLGIQLPTILVWWSVLICIGAIMFAYYQGCDPELAGRIERPDQMMAIFVSDVLGYLQGLPGLFTAVVYSATLRLVRVFSNNLNRRITSVTQNKEKKFFPRKKTFFLKNFVHNTLMANGLRNFVWKIDSYTRLDTN